MSTATGYIRDARSWATATRLASRITSAPNFVHILNYQVLSSRAQKKKKKPNRQLPLNERVLLLDDFPQQFDFVADLFATAGRSVLAGAGRFADAPDGVDRRTASQSGGRLVVRQSVAGRAASTSRQRRGDTGHLSTRKTIITLVYTLRTLLKGNFS